MNSKTHRKLSDVLAKYDLRVEHASKHMKVYTKDNKCVATVSHTGGWNSLKNTMRQLRRAGYVDDAACRINFS